MSIVLYIYCLFLLAMIAQSAAMLYLNLYVWLDDSRLEKTQAPKTLKKSQLRFTILLPAYHEEAVLGQTIAGVAKMRYPKHLYEILVILQPSDTGTIKVAEESIAKNKIKNAKVIVVDSTHTPLNKPYQLNVALEHAAYEHIVIFDSEDNVHPKILSIANTMYLTRDVDVIQAGVQLMNYADRWFSAHNVLEYFFWFKSRMHAHMKLQAAPLGGNTVFFKSAQLKQVGGWNEQCLTEDAELGIRLSEVGAKMCATYDAEYVTREEAPLTVEQFIKQRTRWCQGFLQILQAKTIKRLPKRSQRLMAYYLLGFPVAQAIIIILSPVIILFGVLGNLPFLISMLSFVPVFLVITLIGTQIVGLYELIKEQKMKFRFRAFFWLIFGFLAYQVLLSIGALRACQRQIKKATNWEKTTHTGAHRNTEHVQTKGVL